MNINKLIEKAEELVFNGYADISEEAEVFVELIEINGKRFKLTVNLKQLDSNELEFYERI